MAIYNSMRKAMESISLKAHVFIIAANKKSSLMH